MVPVHHAREEIPLPQPLVEEVAQSLGRHLRWPRQPYPGLRPFNITENADESLIFYGREEQKDEILARLNRAHVVFVIGPSGCGKSSLIKAGVIPALNAGLLTRAGHRWTCARMRPGRRPLAHLAEVLAPLLPETHGSLEERRDAIDQLAREEDSALWLLADAMATKREGEPLKRERVLLILDQLEELFAPEIESGEEVTQFVRLLTRFFERPHENLYLILAMRTDYIGRCASYPHLAEMLNRTQYLTPVLTPAQLKVAITRPAEAYGGRVEPALVEALLKNMAALREDHADQLPLLQHALFRLREQAWRRSGRSEPPRPGQGKMEGVSEIKLEDYEKQGGLHGILDRHAEDIFAEATAGGQGLESLCERVFKRLSERDLEHRYRRAPATLDELADATGAGREAVLTVVRPFMAPDASFLELHETGREGEGLFDISHESLIRQWGRLRHWADQEAEDVHYFRTLIESAQRWDNAGRCGKELRTGGELEVVQKWWNTRSPTPGWARRYHLDHRHAISLDTKLPLVEEYKRACEDYKRACDEQNEKIRQDRERVRREEVEVFKQKRKASRLIAVSFGVFGICAFIVAAVMLAAWQITAERAGEEKARIIAATGQFVLSREGAAEALLLAREALGSNNLPDIPEMRRLARMALADLRLERVIRGHIENVWSVDYRPRDDLLLTADSTGILRIWDIANNVLVAETKLPGLRLSCCRWSPLGDAIFASTREDKKAILIAFDPNAPFERRLTKRLAFEGEASSGIFSPDGRYILTGGSFSSPLRLWNAVNGKKIRDLGGSQVRAVAIDKEGRRVAVATREGTVLLYNVADLEKPERTLHPASLKVNANQDGNSLALAFHPTRPNILAAGSSLGKVLLWDLGGEGEALEAKPRALTTHHDASIFSLAFSPDGGMIATASEDRTVRLIDLDTEEVEVLRGHKGGIWAVTFASSGQQVASGSTDGTARVWNIEPADLDPPADGRADRNELIALANRHVPKTLDQQGDVAPMALDPALRCVVDFSEVEDCLNKVAK